MHTSTEVALVALALAGSVIGLVGVVWTRCRGYAEYAGWGRRLFFIMVALLGLGSLAAAWNPGHVLVYSGLALGGLVIGMLWEGPQFHAASEWVTEEA